MCVCGVCVCVCVCGVCVCVWCVYATTAPPNKTRPAVLLVFAVASGGTAVTRRAASQWMRLPDALGCRLRVSRKSDLESGFFCDQCGPHSMLLAAVYPGRPLRLPDDWALSLPRSLPVCSVLSSEWPPPALSRTSARASFAWTLTRRRSSRAVRADPRHRKDANARNGSCFSDCHGMTVITSSP